MFNCRTKVFVEHYPILNGISETIATEPAFPSYAKLGIGGLKGSAKIS